MVCVWWVCGQCPHRKKLCAKKFAWFRDGLHEPDAYNPTHVYRELCSQFSLLGESLRSDLSLKQFSLPCPKNDNNHGLVFMPFWLNRNFQRLFYSTKQLQRNLVKCSQQLSSIIKQQSWEAKLTSKTEQVTINSYTCISLLKEEFFSILQNNLWNWLYKEMITSTFAVFANKKLASVGFMIIDLAIETIW